MLKISVIFDTKPLQWGYRGDPFLWKDLREYFSSIEAPMDEKVFIYQFKEVFRDYTGYPLDHSKEYIWLKKYSHGGMSSGGIHLEFWREKALPLLCKSLNELNTVAESFI